MQDNIKTPDISIVILCYRTEDFARRFTEKIVSFLEKERVDYELVLVGNYTSRSGDRTPDIVKELAEEYPKVIAVVKPKQGMMGWDMRSGLEAANGRYIAIIDGDGQMPYQDLAKIYKMIKTGNFDLCKTYRTRRDDGIYRKLLSKIYNIIFSVIFYKNPGGDINSKPKIMTKASYDKLTLTSDDWFIDAEIMIQANRLGFKIGEIPTVFEKNIRRTSFVKISAILEFIKNIIIYRIRECFIKRQG
ncbi:glycosyltransferase family 2 protein [Candidatus Omnitrophota bacterium]